MNKLLIMMLGLASTSYVSAQTTNISEFSPALNSKAEQILSALFAGLMNKEGGNPLEGVMGTLNAVVLIVGGILLTYHMFAGLIATAYEGNFMGKKMNLATYPLRTAAAAALVIPIKGGYAGIQFLVMWLITLSIGFADTAWTTFMNGPDFNKSMNITISSVESKTLTGNLLSSYLCLHTLDKVTTKSETNTLSVPHQWGTAVNTQHDGSQIITFGDKLENEGFSIDQCGSLTITEIQSYGVDKDGANSIVAWGEGNSRAKIINNAHKQATFTLSNTLNSIAKNIVDSGNIDMNAINNATATYNNYVKNIATEQVKNLDMFKELAQQSQNDGFVSSIFMYNKLANMADTINKSVVSTSKSSGAKPISDKTYSDMYEIEMRRIRNSIEKTNATTSIAKEYSNGNSADKEVEEVFTKLIGADKEALDGWFSVASNEHPLMAAKRIGNNILNLWTTMVATVGVTMIVGSTSAAVASTKILGTGLDLSTAANALNLFLTSALSYMTPLLWSAAFFLLIVIPLTPIMYILASVIAWIVSCVEAIIIAPLWAVMHIAHGDEMVGSGTQGYRILTNLLLKPLMLVLGIISSYVLIGVIGSFISQSYNELMGSITAGAGILSVLIYKIFGIFIYTALCIVVLISLMKLIFQMPDRIMQWITNSDHTLGGSAQDMSATNGTFAKVGTGAAALAGGAAKSITEGYKKNLEAKESDKKTEKERQEKFNSLPGIEKLQHNMDKDSKYGGNNSSYSNVKAVEDVQGMSGQLDGFQEGLGEQFASAYNEERGEDGNKSDHSTAFQNAFSKTLGSSFEPGSVQANMISSMASDPKSAQSGFSAISKLKDFGSISTSSPEGMMLSAVSGNPEQLNTGIEALSRLKQHGESKGMLAGEINKEISSFASNVSTKTNGFTDGNTQKAIVGEYRKSKDKITTSVLPDIGV